MKSFFHVGVKSPNYKATNLTGKDDILSKSLQDGGNGKHIAIAVVQRSLAILYRQNTQMSIVLYRHKVIVAFCNFHPNLLRVNGHVAGGDFGFVGGDGSHFFLVCHMTALIF